MRDRAQNIVLWKKAGQDIVYFQNHLENVLHITANSKEAMVFNSITRAKKYLKTRSMRTWNWCHLDN